MKSNIHDCPESNVIIINYPGYPGDIDGYQGKYRTLADLIRRKGLGAVIRMDNQCRHGFLYEKSVVADLKATIDYVLVNAESICSSREPDLYLMALASEHRRGASLNRWANGRIFSFLTPNTLPPAH